MIRKSLLLSAMLLAAASPASAQITLSPNTATVGSPAIPLTIGGQFDTSGPAVVYWNSSTTNMTSMLSVGMVFADHITATIPASLLTAPDLAYVYVVQGSLISEQATFTVTQPNATLTNLSPNTAAVGTPGLTLIVNGMNFPLGNPSNPTNVLWNGMVLQTSPGTTTQLTAVVPAFLLTSAGTAQVTISASPQPAPLPFTIFQPLTLTSINPTSALVGSPAISITVKGSGFTQNAQVTWNGASLQTSLLDTQTLQAAVPASLLATAGTAQVTVMQPGSTTPTAIPFTIVPAPALTTLSPPSAVAGGPAYTLTLNGSGFVQQTMAFWNSTALPTTYVSANQLTATVAANLIAQPGMASITAQTAGRISNTILYGVISPQLTLTNISPNAAAAGGPGFTLTANGSGFTSGTSITWNGGSLPTNFVNAGQLTTTIPANLIMTASTAAVGVAAQGLTSPPTLPFVITQGLTLTSLSPSSATAGGGAFTLTVNGMGFTTGIGVYWNGQALATTPISGIQASATVPANLIAQAGSASITVQAGGQTSNALAFTITSSALTLTSISPNSAVAGGPGFTITANGSGFANGASITWNGTALGTTFVSPTQLTAAVPASLIASAGTAAVGVLLSGVATPQTLPFTITPVALTLTSISPNFAVAGSPAFNMTVNGSGFTNNTGVTWNGNLLGTTFVSATQLTAAVPGNLIANVGTALVDVSTPGLASPTPLPFTISQGLTLISLSPASIPPGGAAFNLTVNGAGFTTGTVVYWNNVALATTISSTTMMTAQVPAVLTAQSGSASITAQNGSVVSNALAFTILSQALTLTSLSPGSVTAGTGTFVLSVNGTGFVPPSSSGATTVLWNGTPLTTQYVSPNQLNTTVPATLVTNPGTVQVSVTGQPQPASLPFIITAQVMLTSISPSTVSSGGPGFSLTVNGTGFATGSQVTFNGAALTTNFVSTTQLNAAVTASLIASPGSASIGVTVPNQPSPAPLQLTITSGISLTSLSPSSAAAGGPAFTLTVNGAGFISTTTVSWGATALATTYVSPTQLTVGVPASLIAQAGSVPVTAANGSVVSNALTFTIASQAPVITSISPASVASGTAALSLAVTGTGFLTGAVVSFNSTALVTTFVSATQVTAVIPASMLAQPGSAQITVANPTGPASNAVTFTIAGPAPTITSINPSSAAAGGPAFSLNVNGTGFFSGAIVFWGATKLNTSFISATQLTAAVTADLIAQAGAVQITATNNGSAPSNAVTFTVTPGPAITSISPASVAAGGPAFTLTVTGTNFANGATVSFNSTALSTTFVSATQLTAQVPANLTAQSATAQITVVNPGGNTSNAVTLTIGGRPPMLTSISPSSVAQGSAAFTLTVTGTGFVPGATVLLGNTSLVTTFVGSVQLTAAVTSDLLQQQGPQPVTVTNPGGGASNPLPLTVTPPIPTIISITPVSAKVGDATFTLSLTGTGFVQASIVQWDGAPLSTTFVSGTQLTATIAAGRLILPATASVTVANPGADGNPLVSNALMFTINPVTPVVTSISPTSATAGDPGFSLTVNGTGLLNLTTIQWNTTTLTTHFVSATQVTADVPATLLAQPGTATVTAVNPGNNVSAAFTFTINPGAPPVITSLSKTFATAGDAAFTLTVTGTGFVSGAVVNFGTIVLATTFVSATQLTAAVPANLLTVPTTFQLVVQQAGMASNALRFTVNLPAAPSLRLTPPAGTGPAQQPTIDFGLNAAYPISMLGVVTLSFVSNATVPVDDPAIQFATGGRTMSFTVPPNTTTLPALQLSTGTVSGTITIAVTLTAGGFDVTPPGSSATIVIGKAAPVMITGKVKLVRAAGYVEVDITGFSTTRDMTQAVFHLNAAPNALFTATDITVPLSGPFSTWYQSAASVPFGSQFSYAQPFSVIGDTNQIQSVTVTLTNSAGTSVSMTTN